MGDVVSLGRSHVGIFLGHDIYISATAFTHPKKDNYFGQKHLIIKELASLMLVFRRPVSIK
ncbi:hypothetical protein MNBD_UNCLBAC01-642 [hydrothermal vent metagenome]|uniref:Uncharacterized protein n=1 Tax=hydrothermal vent metagenome TaxID=652676 RepID=A0A3B1D486_9ZZZZ